MKPKGKKLHLRIFFACTAAAMIAATAYAAQEPVVFPAKGQSNDKMETDKYACYQWAKGQTGVDPMQGATASSASTTEGAGRTAAKGAALGAVGGAIGGNAGKGAAIGAATGGIIGGARKRQSQKQQEASAQGSKAEYNRAWGACMEGKGYTVK